MGGKGLPQPNPHHHYLQRVQVGRVLMHQVRPPEVGTGHPQLAPAPCPLGHDPAFLIQETHFKLEVLTALDDDLVIHQPCRRQDRSDKREEGGM